MIGMVVFGDDEEMVKRVWKWLWMGRAVEGEDEGMGFGF